ncbi:MAG: ribonuclease E/G, partial [Candidatus Obscuribacterales bacterium]|nr:ribonuclease E/G [Candidatus Obscuribacterales bacterium]
LLISRGIDKDIESVLSDRAELPSGGHLNIQPTEALTVIDVNSGRFTSSRTQAETVRKTNLEAAQEIPRQLRLRNIGGMVIVDFIDMESRRDQQQVLEVFNRSLEDDRAKPQVGQMSDLGLVELTRRRQGQSLRELFAEPCSHCSGTGAVPTLTLGSGEFKRVISLPNKEEEANKKAMGKRGNGSGRQGAAMRAVSANTNRIQTSSVQDFEPEAELELEAEADHEVTEEIDIDVPVEILEQMPEELLEGLTAAASQESYKARSKYPIADEESDEEEDAKPVLSNNTYRSSYRKEESFEEPETINVEPQEAEAQEENSVEVAVAEEENEVEASVEELAEIETPALVVQAAPLPESDFETEIDPVTGIYRLKPKEKNEANEEHSGSEALSEDSASSRETYYQDSSAQEIENTQAESDSHEQAKQLELALEHSHEHGHSHEHSDKHALEHSHEQDNQNNSEEKPVEVQQYGWGGSND